MNTLNVNKAEFIKSAANPSGFIRSEFPNIVFSGKSNVGKSSVINRLLNRKNFARVGQSPGKTIHVNYFLIDKKAYFVDLPGYGYAKVSRTEKERWGKLMEQFFAAEGLITLGVMMVVVANKSDKLKKSEIEPNMALIRETLELPEDTVLIPFSAEKGNGKDALMSEILKYV